MAAVAAVTNEPIPLEGVFSQHQEEKLHFAKVQKASQQTAEQKRSHKEEKEKLGQTRVAKALRHKRPQVFC